MQFFRSHKKIIYAIVVFLIGVAVVFANYAMKKEVKSDENVKDAYLEVIKNKCYLDDWVIQTLQIGSSDKNVPQIRSDLDLNKYNAGLKIRVVKRLISVDGKRYSENVPIDAKFAIFEKTNFFIYKCADKKTFKSKVGFFDRATGVPK